MLTNLPEAPREDAHLNAPVNFYFNEDVEEGEEPIRPVLPDTHLPEPIIGVAKRLVVSSSLATTTTTLAYGLQTIKAAIRAHQAYRDWRVFTHLVNIDGGMGMVGITPENGALHGDWQQTVFWVVRYRRG